MKRTMLVLLALVMVLGLCACGSDENATIDKPTTPTIPTTIKPVRVISTTELEATIEEYVFENYRLTIGDATSEPVDVTLIDVTEYGDYEWLVLGSYTVKIQGEMMSSTFVMSVEYSTYTEKFNFSDETFDRFE